MKPLRFFTFRILCLTVSFSILTTLTQAEDKLKITKAQTQPSPSAHSIQFVNDLLTVKVKDVSMKVLLQEIARQSGLSVVGSGSLDDKITIEFHNLPLDEGIRRILRHHSFALAYARQTPGERHSTVPGKLWIFSKTEKGYPVQTTVVEDAKGGYSLQDVATDIPGLQAALMSEELWEREDAVDTLGESGNPAAIDLLSVALEDADEDVREAAIYALANIGGDEAARALAVALQDDSASVREEAIEVLGEIGGEAATQVLDVALQDDDASVREEAIEALGEIGGESAILILEQALADENESIRDTAAELLTKLRTQTLRNTKRGLP